MNIFIWDELSKYPFPAFLHDVSQKELYENWEAYKPRAEQYIKEIFSHVRGFHGTKADKVSIQEQGLKFLSLDAQEEIILASIKEQGASNEETLQCLNYINHEAPYKQARNQPKLHSICFHSSLQSALESNSFYTEGSEFQNTFLTPVKHKYKIQGIPLIIHVNIPINVLDTLFKKHGLIQLYLLQKIIQHHELSGYSTNSDITLNIYHDIPKEWLAKIEHIQCTP